MVRVFRVLVVTLALITVFTPAAHATSSKTLSDYLGATWRTVLELPKSQSPYYTTNYCIDIGGEGRNSVVVPFAPLGVDKLTCTVGPGARVFVSAFSSECSTAEARPYFGRNERELRKCAEKVDRKVKTPVVTLDGRNVAVQEVETALLNVIMPADNILEAPEGEAVKSVGHGWVALLPALRPGTHTIKLRTTGTYLDAPLDVRNTTTIIVKPGR